MIFFKVSVMKTVLSVLKLLILIGITIGLPAYVLVTHPEMIESFKSVDGVNAFLAEYETASIFAYIGMQIIQIVISVIPGQFIPIAGGYAYGFWFGYFFSIIGIAAGTAVAFGLARVLGRDALHLLFGEEKVTKFINHLNSKRAFAVLVVLYAIPGLPKDIVTYAAGVSEFGFKPFMILSLIARTPALMCTVMIGSMLNKGSYLGIIILGVSAILLCVILFIKREQLIHYVDTLYQKLITPKKDQF
jgi:uncharacterized membrane protein YdjX (TVP38/TMEM64 family)